MFFKPFNLYKNISRIYTIRSISDSTKSDKQKINNPISSQSETLIINELLGRKYYYSEIHLNETFSEKLFLLMQENKEKTMKETECKFENSNFPDKNTSKEDLHIFYNNCLNPLLDEQINDYKETYFVMDNDIKIEKPRIKKKSMKQLFLSIFQYTLNIIFKTPNNSEKKLTVEEMNLFKPINKIKQYNSLFNFYLFLNTENNTNEFKFYLITEITFPDSFKKTNKTDTEIKNILQYLHFSWLISLNFIFSNDYDIFSSKYNLQQVIRKVLGFFRTKFVNQYFRSQNMILKTIKNTGLNLNTIDFLNCHQLVDIKTLATLPFSKSFFREIERIVKIKTNITEIHDNSFLSSIKQFKKNNNTSNHGLDIQQENKVKSKVKRKPKLNIGIENQANERPSEQINSSDSLDKFDQIDQPQNISIKNEITAVSTTPSLPKE